jgi:ferritin-like metal-binding protein YciE
MLEKLQKLETPEEIFSFKLGAALKMEETVLEMLEDIQAQTPREELRELFDLHAAETRQQIANIEESFRLLGEDVGTSPCPAIEGLQKEGKANANMTDDSIVDAVLLSGAVETEHHEIAVYETLVTNAKARGADDVAQLLQQNLDQELATLEKVKQTAERIANTGVAVSA